MFCSKMQFVKLKQISYIGVLFSLIFVAHATFSEEKFNSKYEYKYSFKGPNLAQAGQGIPFWNHSFDAFPGEDQVRVVPSLRAKVGAVWSKFPFSQEEWKVEIAFRVHGRGRLGADGFVLWYVEKPNVYGPVFGSMDQWKGLGLFFDSYDNDGMKNNPYIYVIINDGNLSYSHETDGGSQMQGGCSRDFRNKPYPVKARIVYADNQLEVYIDSGNSAVEDYEFCTVINDVTLPKDYHFGISAATGALADDHDILKFQTWSLTKKTEGEEPDAVDEEAKKRMEAQKKLDEEYEKNLQEFYTDQKKFQEEHPDKVKKDYGKPDDLFQGEASVELRAVFEVQSSIKQQVSDLSKSVVLIMERQDKIASKLDENQPTDINVAKSHQVENIIEMQRSTKDSLSEVQNQIRFLKAHSESLKDSIAKLSSNSVGTKTDVENPYDAKQQLKEIIQKIDSLYVGVSTLNSQQQKEKTQPRVICPDPDTPSCVSSVVLLIIAALQVIVIIAYHSLKQSREDAAKKFF